MVEASHIRSKETEETFDSGNKNRLLKENKHNTEENNMYKYYSYQCLPVCVVDVTVIF